MSINPAPTVAPKDTTTSGPSTRQLVANYLLPVVVVVGLLILIAIGKVSSATGLPLVAAIVGVHGGAAITNNASG